MKQKPFAVVVLAAGKSTRMKSELPKVLHPLCGRPVLAYVFDLVHKMKPQKQVVVLGYKHREIRPYLPAGVRIALQRKMRGTADAMKTALGALRSFNGDILVLYGDNPLLKRATIDALLKHHRSHACAVTLLTAVLPKPDGYGRILRDATFSIKGIIEEKDASDFQRTIKEINTGIMCFSAKSLLYAVKRIRPSNRKKEYYLTDAIGILYEKGEIVGGVKARDADEALGINSREELAAADKIMQARITSRLMRRGVSIVDPANVSIAYDVRIGADTTIYPFTVIESGVTIGKRASIGPYAHIHAQTRIKDNGVVAG